MCEQEVQKRCQNQSVRKHWLFSTLLNLYLSFLWPIITRYPIPLNKNILRISEAQNCSFFKNIEAHSNF